MAMFVGTLGPATFFHAPMAACSIRSVGRTPAIMRSGTGGTRTGDPPRGGFRRVLAQSIFDETRENLVGVEALVGNGAGRCRVARVAPLHFPNRRDRLLDRREGNNAFADGEDSGKASILDDHRPASGQVACRTLAEPATPSLYIGILRHAP